MRIANKLPLLLPIGGAVLAAVLLSASTEPTIRVAPMDSVGPRPVEEQTQSSVIRDYLLAWQTMNGALSQNRTDQLDTVFVGRAKEKLAETVHEQQTLGIETSYLPKSHDIKVVFYSPDGLSIQLLDDVEYDVDVKKGAQSIGSEHVRTRYVAVLSPTETRWKVRVLQGGAL
ncbi:MAG: hypothetical protein WBV46_04150 [Terriglobales bacterium]|jgi:hypothetical protein